MEKEHGPFDYAELESSNAKENDDTLKRSKRANPGNGFSTKVNI